MPETVGICRPWSAVFYVCAVDCGVVVSELSGVGWCRALEGVVFKPYTQNPLNPASVLPGLCF